MSQFYSKPRHSVFCEKGFQTVGLKRLLDATHSTCESPVNIDAQNFTIHFTHKSYSIFLSSNSHIMKVQYKDPYEHVTIQPIIQSQHIELATLALLQCLCTVSAYIVSIYCSIFCQHILWHILSAYIVCIYYSIMSAYHMFYYIWQNCSIEAVCAPLYSRHTGFNKDTKMFWMGHRHG